jgi:hypothetical protein
MEIPTSQNTQQIEDQIVSALKAITEQFAKGARDPGCTNAIKQAVGALGQKLGYSLDVRVNCVICGLRGNFNPGYFLDLYWYSISADKEPMDMTLALESNWSTNHEHVFRDIEKLLSAKSKFKVMVYRAKGKAVAKCFKKLERRIRACKGGSSGEVYLLACLNRDTRELEVKRIAIAERKKLK